MFGEIIYQRGDYVERLLADEQDMRVVLCTSGNTTKLYRIEWTESEGYGRNQAVYSLLSAIEAFQTVVDAARAQRAERKKGRGTHGLTWQNDQGGG